MPARPRPHRYQQLSIPGEEFDGRHVLSQYKSFTAERTFLALEDTFSVYGYTRDGSIEPLAECPTHALAEIVLRALEEYAKIKNPSRKD